MELVPGLLQYVTEAVHRIEQKVEMIEVNQSDVARQLSNMKRKQEMVLTKQDQIQSTLHGDTAVIQSRASSVLAGGVTPPLTSPTSTLTTYPQLPGPVPRQTATPSAVSESDITSVLDDCDIESLLGLDPFPPVNLKSVAEPPVNIQSEAGHSANVAREKGPLTEFLTTGVSPHIDSAGLMHLGAVAELLQSLSAGKNVAPHGTGVVAGCPQDHTAQPAAVPFMLASTKPQTVAQSQPRPPQLGAAAGPHQLGFSAGPPQLGTSAGPPQLGSSAEPPQLGTAAGPPQLGTAAGPPQLGTAAGQPQLGTTAGPSQLGIAAGPPQLGTSAALLQLGTTAGPSQLGNAAGPPQLGTAAGPPQLGTAAGPPQLGTTAGPSQLGIAAGPPQLGTSAALLQLGTAIRTPQLGTTARPLQLGAAVEPPHTLQDASVVMGLLEFRIVDETNVGKFARALASRVVFGDDILHRSTFKGDSRRGLEMLDRTKLNRLFTLIHCHPSFADWTKADFDVLVKKKIIPSISHLCKELRR